MTSLWFTSALSVLVATATGVATQAEPNSALFIGSIALLGGAIVFFLLEIIVPSGGLFALLCSACIIASIVVMFMYDGTLGVLMLIAYIINTTNDHYVQR